MRKLTAGLLALAILLCCAAAFADGGIAAGDKVTFGKYPQHVKTGSIPADPEPIVWRVLDVDGEKALLLSEQSLNGIAYNSDDSFLYEVTWETCSLRKWLNGDFLNDAFSSKEKKAIRETHITTPDNREFGIVISGGNDTTDKVFVLSTDEAKKYLKTKDSRICSPTDYTAYCTEAGSTWGFYSDDSHYVAEYIDNVCIWWLRNPGRIGHYAAYCDFTGDIRTEGKYAGRVEYAVRPALWADTGSLKKAP